ncbi:pilus assembly protein N-terminal domain-containing protein [Rhodoblastus sp.]|uniref:pilus assembly protein N-terminal domain-containing protein n=1 Tax=Rhodoblastus sp. TaxID=1962975 RepID=UPI00263457F1|nr:pilus assembly protein N-terminal domain-containing protein [Rhodoblastus sp.]
MRFHAFRSMGAAFVLVGVLSVGGARAASNDIVLVAIDKARVARIPDKTDTLVVGQPAIADVTILKSTGLGVITGKNFGETNLIALDAKGALLGEWTVRVSAEKPDLLLQDGETRVDMICSPQCLKAIVRGDDKPAHP